MTHYDRLKKKRLGDILVDEHLATEEIVIAALQEQQRSGRLLSDILLEGESVAEFDLARVVVEQYQTPFIDLKSYAIHKDLIELFPPDLLHRAGAVPLDKYGKQMCFACQEVPPKEIADELRKYSPGGIYVYIASSLEIRQVLNDYASRADEKTPPAPVPVAAAKGASVEDSAWKELFDAANESILTDLSRPGDEG